MGENQQEDWDEEMENLARKLASDTTERFLAFGKNLMVGVAIGIFGGLIASDLIALMMIRGVDESWYWILICAGLAFVVVSFVVVWSRPYASYLERTSLEEIRKTMKLVRVGGGTEPESIKLEETVVVDNSVKTSPLKKTGQESVETIAEDEAKGRG